MRLERNRRIIEKYREGKIIKERKTRKRLNKGHIRRNFRTNEIIRSKKTKFKKTKKREIRQ